MDDVPRGLGAERRRAKTHTRHRHQPRRLRMGIASCLSESSAGRYGQRRLAKAQSTKPRPYPMGPRARFATESPAIPQHTNRFERRSRELLCERLDTGHYRNHPAGAADTRIGRTKQTGRSTNPAAAGTTLSRRPCSDLTGRFLKTSENIKHSPT